MPAAAYALYVLGISVMPVVLFTALAALMFLRLDPQRSKLFYSFTVIVIPVVAITSGFPQMNRTIGMSKQLIRILLVSNHTLFLQQITGH